MIKADQAIEELTLELQRLRKRITELEAFHTERQPGGETLQQSEAQTILESFAEGLLVLDKKGRLIDANKKLEEISGYQKKELVGKTTLSLARLLTHKGLTVFWRNPLKRTNDASETPYEVDIFKKNGELITVQIICHHLKTDGKMAGHLVILEDVTERRRAERESSGSEEVYKSLVNNVGVGIFKTTPGGSGRFLEVNLAMEAITGYSREELLKMDVSDLYAHPEERADHVKKVLSGVPTTSWEVRFKKKDGTEITVRDSKVAIRSNDGKALYLEGFLEDITKRKKAEQVLQESEESLHNSLDSSPMGIYIIDADLNTLYANQALLDIFGYENIDEIRAKPLDEHYTPESRLDLAQRRERHLRGESNPETFELDIVRNDGAIRHLQAFRKEILWGGKKQRQVIYSDITERKQAEDALRESEEKYRLIVENTQDLIFTVNSVGELTYSSASFKHVLGYDNADIIGHSFRTLIHPEDISALEEAMRHNISDGYQKSGGIEFRVRRASRDWRWYSGRGTTLREANGKFTNFLGIANDITERKQTEQALLASEQNFRNSIDSSLMGIRIVDAEWHTLYVNRVFLDIFGFKNIEEVRRTSLQDRYTPEERARYLRRQEKRERGESVPDSPAVEIVGRDGAIHVIRVYLNEVFWDGKQQRQLIYQDVTDLQQAEKALQSSERNFRNSMDSSLMGIRIMGDHDYTVYANQALLDMFGYQNIEELRASPPQEHYTPESHAAFIQRKEQFARGESLPDQVEFDIIRKDGAIRHLHLFSKEVLWNGKQQHQFVYNDISEGKQAEEELKASEQNLRNFLDNSVMGIRIRTDGYIEYVNQALLDILGCENIDELRASPLEERYTSESQADFLTRKEKISQGEPVAKQIEVDIVRKDGTIRHLQVFGRQVPWKGKTQTQTFYNDITERKTLEANNAYLATFPEMNTDPIMELDLEGNLRYLNPASKRIFPDLAMLGLSHPVLADWGQLLKQIRPGKLVQPIIHEVSFGDLFYEQAYVPVNEKWIRIYCRDVTERKRAENQVKESEENLRAYLENAPDGIYINDLKGCFLYGNKKAEEILGCEKGELIASNFLKLNLLPAKYLAKAGKLLALNAMGRNTGPDEFELVRKDKTLTWVEINTALIKQKDKKVVIGFVREIGERKRVEQRLEQAAQEWKTTFDSISDLIMIHDKDNRIVRVNKAMADILKMTPKDLVGKFCHEVMHCTKEPPANCPHMQTLKTGKSSGVEKFNTDLWNLLPRIRIAAI